MGPRISWKKAMFGKRVKWIGVQLDASAPACFLLQLPPKFCEELTAEIAEIMGKRAVEERRLKRLAARAGWASAVCAELSGHIAPLWAAAADAARSAGSGAGESRAVLVGVRRAPGIGLALTLAVGGVAVELLGDGTAVILPAGRARIEEALRSLKLFPLLDGWRGRPRADLSAALDAIEVVCAFAEARRDRLEELEINPLVLTADCAVAVDAVL